MELYYTEEEEEEKDSNIMGPIKVTPGPGQQKRKLLTFWLFFYFLLCV